jgi:2-octaprenyl-6-methoxyphenol hydroxylase
MNQPIVIVGGGPVGGTVALALAGSGLAVTVLEARAAPEVHDPRAIALSEGSRLILQRLGVWNALESHATPMSTIHVSEKGRLGRTILTAEQVQRPALGYVVDYSALVGSVDQAMCDAGVDVVRGASVNALLPQAASCQIRFMREGQAQEISAQLAVLADGGRSLSSIQNLKRKVHEYQQHALVARVHTELPHNGVAYERFTPNGPVALLPWGDGYALVWTASPERAEALCGLDEQAFLSQLHQHFGDRQGAFVNVTGRSVFPLKLAWVRPVTAERIAVIGNAAQTLHPVAGQGFNLGLRDAWELAQILLSTPTEAIGSEAMLTQYRQSRRLDTGGGMLFTDLLVRTFSTDAPALGAVRGAGLVALELLAPARDFLLRKMSFGARG